MARLAVFDVCWTLYRTNTTAGFVEFFHAERGGFAGRAVAALVRRKWSPVRYLLLALARLSGRDLPRAVLIASLRGHEEDSLRAAAVRYVEGPLAKLRIEATHELLETRRAAGEEIILLSSSLEIVVSAVAEQLGAAYEASRLAFRDGRCTGRLTTDLTGRKPEALTRMRAGAAPESLFVCTDNWTDRRLLDQAAERVVVVHGATLHKDLRGLHAEFLHAD